MISPLLREAVERSQSCQLLLFEGRVALAGPALAEVCGCDPRELAGREAAGLFADPPVDGATVETRLLAGGEGTPVRVTARSEQGLRLLTLELPGRPGGMELARRLQAILEISRKMAGSLDWRELLQEITAACHHLVDANDTTVYGMHPDGERLVPLFTDDRAWQDPTMNFQIPLGTGLTGHVAQSGRAAIVNDPHASELVVQVPGTPDEIDEVLMSVPLAAGDRVLGVITISRPLERPFGPADLEIISILAGQAAALLSQAAALRRLAESEQQFRSLVENADIGLFRLAPDGAVEAVNPYVCRVLGLASAIDVEPRRIWGSERAHQDFMARLAADGAVEDASVTTMRQDGRLVDLRLSARSVPGQAAFEGSLRDDTDRRRLELENQARLVFLENLLARLPMGLVILEPSGRARYHNPAFATLVRTAEADTGGNAFHALRRALPEIEALWQRALRHEAGRKDEIALPPELSPDGGLRHVSAITVPVGNQAGVLTDVVFLLADISEHLALRSQLIQSQKMDSVGSLAGGLAHDFNNILAGILGEAEQLRSLLSGDAEAQTPLDSIERSVGLAAQLTRQLLGFARQGGERLEPLDVGFVLGQTLGLFRRGLKPGLRLEEALGEDLPLVRGDALQVEQAVLNLLFNAADAVGGEGTITLRSRLRSEAGDPGGAEAAAWLEVEVQDTGRGIAPELLPRVFDPFFTTKEKGQGSGLGLAMVFNIMQRHGGRAEIQSRVGYGTRVRLLFPVPAEAAPAIPAAERAGTAQIWIVDDDPVLRDMLRRILESQRYEVRAFEDGPALLEALRRAPGAPDLFVLDLLMPGMSGLELRQEIAGLRPDLRVIFCSGVNQVQQGELLELTGVKGFIEKPFTIASLAGLVQQALR